MTTSARLIAYHQELTAGGLSPDLVTALVQDAAHIEVTDRGLRVTSDLASSHAKPALQAESTGPGFVDQYSNPSFIGTETRPDLH